MTDLPQNLLNQNPYLMQHPDANLLYNPDPEYLRELIARSGLSQREAARRIGISERVMRQYLAHRDSSTSLNAPYPVQYCLEHLPPFIA